MDGQISRGFRKMVDRPKDKTVLGTRLIFKRKNGEDGNVEIYKCSYIAQGFRQIKEIKYRESSSPMQT